MLCCNLSSCVPWLRRDLFSAAVQDGRVQDVVSLLQRHGDLVGQQSHKYRHSPWHVASHRGHLPVLEALVDAVLKGSHSSLLFTASLHRKLFASATTSITHATPEVVLRNCLMHGIRGGYTPLHLAARAGHQDVVAYLLALGADCWQPDCVGLTAIHHAARHNKFLAVQELVKQAPPPSSLAPRLAKPATKYINCPDLTGWTPLHYAVCGKHEETVATLLSCGANLIARTGTSKPHPSFSQFPPGSTALHIAACQGNLPMIIQVLRAHFEGLASLLPGHLDTVERRRRQRVHPDPRLVISRTGQLPYHLARHLRRTDICEFLDPSVPLQFLLSATDEGAAGINSGAGNPAAGRATRSAVALAVVGVPRLSLLAAKALHGLLLSDLKQAEADKAEYAAQQVAQQQARMLAAEEAAKQKGVWLVKRAARRSLLVEQAAEGVDGPGASGRASAARRFKSRTSRRAAAPSTPRRIMDALRTSIGIFSPQHPETSSIAPHLRLALEMPDNPEANPFARMAPARRTGSVDSSAVLQQPYSLVQITTRAAAPPGSLQETPSPTVRSTIALSAPPHLSRFATEQGGASSAWDQQQQEGGEGGCGSEQGQRPLLLTAAHDDALTLVAPGPILGSSCTESRGLSHTSRSVVPSRWVSGASRDAKATAGDATALSAELQGQPQSNDQDDALVAVLPNIRVGRPAQSLTELSSRTRLQFTSVGDASPTTPVGQSARTAQQPAPAVRLLPGAASPVPASPAPPTLLEPALLTSPGANVVSSLSVLRPAALPTGSQLALRERESSGDPGAAGDGWRQHPREAARAAGVNAPGTDDQRAESAVCGSEPCLAQAPDVEPEANSEGDVQDGQRRSAARALLQSLTRPFRMVSQVQPTVGNDASGRVPAVSSGFSPPLGSLPRPAQGGTPVHGAINDDAPSHESLAQHSNIRVADKATGLEDEPLQGQEEEDVCPVCLDDVPDVQLVACKHSLCLGCAKDLSKRHCLTPALCPYCRAIICGFRLLHTGKAY